MEVTDYITVSAAAAIVLAFSGTGLWLYRKERVPIRTFLVMFFAGVTTLFLVPATVCLVGGLIGFVETLFAPPREQFFILLFWFAFFAAIAAAVAAAFLQAIRWAAPFRLDRRFWRAVASLYIGSLSVLLVFTLALVIRSLP